MVASSGGPQLPFANLFVASAISACTAEVRRLCGAEFYSSNLCNTFNLSLQALTLPLDTAKVKLQLQGAGGGKYKCDRTTPRLHGAGGAHMPSKCS